MGIVQELYLMTLEIKSPRHRHVVFGPPWKSEEPTAVQGISLRAAHLRDACEITVRAAPALPADSVENRVKDIAP